MRPPAAAGVLLGGVPGVRPAKVVVIGGGVAGQNAAAIASAWAPTSPCSTSTCQAAPLDARFGGRVRTLRVQRPTRSSESASSADLVIGAVLVPGRPAPKLVSNDLVKPMKPGSVLVDIAIDQGGCFEDSRPTTHADPTYAVHDSVFYCVANMPGAVPAHVDPTR